ncbi:X-linked retinitis pigmentosa GTPase regulator-like isoform X2 [Zootermopsis nevadensis]|nr:X-linked retinitis pigmentosa GTPase regulator-like isoform X2 [Zootermopsis nevadensis]XP_021936887.1 X-linked retinitis pigmentosa GTPase regulator-like isoform X2 [Zootermopsis nevadensis]XP_021936888.1 X-linked retinitis pigmentosa GTPase regulator-like isoform X2 [Zootermopsis nevadensis]
MLPIDCFKMAENNYDVLPETGAVFTFGRSRFADNIPSHFYIRNDPILEVACGDEHTAVICQKGRVFVFGNNDYGQLGLGHKNVTVKPSCVKSLKPEKATHVACGRAHTLLSTDSGKIFSWGNNSDGQLGVGDVADRSAPTRVLGIRDEIIQLSAGCISSAALTACGHVYVWGSNSGGQLGLPETNDSVLSPVLMPFDQQIVHISFGYYHTAFVTASSTLYTCGESESGKLGLPDSLTNITSPQKVTLGIPIKSVFCGGNHTVALAAGGEVFAFGNNFNGQLGLGVDVPQSVLPTRVTSLEGCVIRDVACGESHTAFITDAGSLYTCGEGRHGKLCSEQDNDNQLIPFKVTKFKGYTVQKVACGGCHAMVLASARQDDENGLDLISHSLESESEENSVWPINNWNTLPPLQHIPVQSPNNNTESIRSFQEDLSSRVDEMVIERDLEVKSALSGRKESSGADDDIDDEMSAKSAKPKNGKKEVISKSMGVTENSDVNDEIKSTDDKSEGDRSNCDDGGGNQEDNSDVKMESEENKEGRVARFFSAFRRKKPS